MFRYLSILLLAAACAHNQPVPHCYDDETWHPPMRLDQDTLTGDSDHWDFPGSGGAIKTWATNETLTSTALNANFNHIHTNMVGGHGARLVDADVSASANIGTSKLEAYRLVPVAWASVSDCTASPCTVIASQGVTQVTRSGAGAYSVTLSTPRPNTNYMGVVSPHRTAVGAQAWCYTAAIVSTTVVPVACTTDSTPTVDDSGFSIVVYDND